MASNSNTQIVHFALMASWTLKDMAGQPATPLPHHKKPTLWSGFMNLVNPDFQRPAAFLKKPDKWNDNPKK